MGRFKIWSTRELVAAGLTAPACPVWTRHGSTRYLWNLAARERAVQYVNDWQDLPERFAEQARQRGLPQ